MLWWPGIETESFAGFPSLLGSKMERALFEPVEMLRFKGGQRDRPEKGAKEY